LATLVSEKVIEACAKAGAIKSFQTAFEAMNWGRLGRGIMTQIADIICSIPLMSESAQKRFFQDTHCISALQCCLSNKDAVWALLDRIGKLDLGQRLKLLNQTDATGKTFAKHMVEQSKLPDLALKLYSPIILSIPSMSKLELEEFLQNPNRYDALYPCLADGNTASILLTKIEELEPIARRELLTRVSANGHTLAGYIAEKCRLPGLVPKLFNLVGKDADLLSMFKHVPENGNAFGLVICGWNSASTAIDFLKYISKFPANERVEILSHRNVDRKNIHNVIIEHHKDPNVSAAFFECLEGMTPDQRARCM
jgi:hypothetical protein